MTTPREPQRIANRKPPFMVVPPPDTNDHGPVPQLPPRPFILDALPDSGLRSLLLKAFLVGCAAAISTGILIGLAIMWFVIR